MPVPPLYKYCKHENFEALEATGSLRLGTPGNYADIEKYGALIGDRWEGAFPMAGTAVMPAGSRMPGGSVAFQGATRVTAIGCATYALNNRYIFCVSEVYSPELHRRLKDDPQAGYDTCYRILDPIAFFHTISNDLVRIADLVRIEPVRYRTGVVLLDSALAYAPPEMVKDRDIYADLREVRAVWRARDGHDVEPLIRHVAGVRHLCEMVATI